MNAARVPTFLAVVAVLVVTGGGMVAAGGGEAARPPAAPPVRAGLTWATGERPAPDVELRDQDGRRMSSAGAGSQSTVVTFLSSRCVEQCPLIGRLLTRVWDELAPAERPRLVVVSVDPWSDTPSSARTFVAHTGWPGEWHWLMGDERTLRRAWRGYAVAVRRTATDVEHSAVAYLLDRRGSVRAAYLVPFDPRDLAADARSLARE